MFRTTIQRWCNPVMTFTKGGVREEYSIFGINITFDYELSYEETLGFCNYLENIGKITTVANSAGDLCQVSYIYNGEAVVSEVY